MGRRRLREGEEKKGEAISGVVKGEKRRYIEEEEDTKGGREKGNNLAGILWR
jgi:hypothetical protein